MDEGAGDQSDFLCFSAGEGAGGGTRTVVVRVADGEDAFPLLCADERGRLRVQGARNGRAVDARELGDAVYGDGLFHGNAVKSNEFVQLLA